MSCQQTLFTEYFYCSLRLNTETDTLKVDTSTSSQSESTKAFVPVYFIKPDNKPISQHTPKRVIAGKAQMILIIKNERCQ